MPGSEDLAERDHEVIESGVDDFESTLSNAEIADKGKRAMRALEEFSVALMSAERSAVRSVLYDRTIDVKHREVTAGDDGKEERE